MSNEPMWIDDVRGLRVDMQEMTKSVDGLTERQRLTDVTVDTKADKSRVDDLTELYEGKKWNRRLAVAALVLVLAGFWWQARSNSDRIDDQHNAARERRVSFCHSLDDLATMVKAGSTGSIQAIFDFAGPTSDPTQVQAFVDDFNTHGGRAVDAALHQVKATNGFTDDCHDL